MRIYGTYRCHKTRFYKDYFASRKLLNFTFRDVEHDEAVAEDLRGLDSSKK